MKLANGDHVTAGGCHSHNCTLVAKHPSGNHVSKDAVIAIKEKFVTKLLFCNFKQLLSKAASKQGLYRFMPRKV